MDRAAQTTAEGAPGAVGAATRHLGLDLGGTNLKWAVLSRVGDAWEMVARDQEPTRVVPDVDAIPDAIVAQFCGLATAAIGAWGPVASIGVGIPGRYYPETGRVRFLPNVPGPWAGHPVGEPIAAATGLPVALVNDARAFGMGELRLGAARGASSMIGFTLGTGVGGAIVIDGRLLQGHDGTAGEMGHQTIDPDGPWCGCGNRGCMEAYARADQVAAACGTATAEEAVRAAGAGDAQALRGLAEVGRYLGIGLASMVNVITPDVIVLGGGVAAAGELLFEPVRAEILRRARMTDAARVALVPAELGIWAGAYGAAVYGAERAGLA